MQANCEPPKCAQTSARVYETERLARAIAAGDLKTRCEPSQATPEFRPIVEGFNRTLEEVIRPLNVAAKYLDDISKGNLPLKIAESYNGDFNTIKNNLKHCIDVLNALLVARLHAGRKAKAKSDSGLKVELRPDVDDTAFEQFSITPK
jgi:hypothetical protein